jgi:hypothetical protein
MEYITLDEALTVTGMTEKTLKSKLRGNVVQYGKGSWKRSEFFRFLEVAWNDRQHNKLFDNKITSIQRANGYLNEIHS